MVEKVLITGGAGFIGSHLLQHLSKKGYDVVGVDNFQNPVRDWTKLKNVTQMDVTSLYKITAGGRELIALPFKEKFDAVIHLAATISVDYSLEEPWSSLYNNIVGTLNMLEYCRLTDAKMIYASSCEVYGSSQYGDKPMDERHPINPASPYGYSKYVGELLCRSYHQTYGLKVNIMRCFNVYGEGQRETDYGGAIAKFTARALSNLPPEIYGSGEQTRDYTYVADIVRAYELSLEADFKGEPVNFGSGREVKIKDLAELIISLCGKKGLKPVHVKPRPFEVMRSWCDPRKAYELLGWKAEVPLEKGLKKYVRWRRKHG
ncbi:MAG: GDP-mannose 4,6-dehydratase [Nitrososphaerota archaeon]